jgi:hypothetical protein
MAALVVLGVAEGLARLGVYIHNPSPANHHFFAAKMAMAEKIQPGRGPLWVVMGNSVMGNGVFTDLVNLRLAQQGINAQVVNLAVPGSNADMAVWLIQAMARHGVYPTGILMNLNPDDLTAGSNAAWSTLKDSYWGDCRLRPPTGLASRVGCWVIEQSYLVRYRRNWKLLLRDLPLILDSPEGKPSPWGELAYQSNGGWQPMMGVIADSQVPATAKVNAVPHPPPNTVAAQWVTNLNQHPIVPPNSPLGRFLLACRHHHTQVVLVAMPFYHQTTPPQVWQQLRHQTDVKFLDAQGWIRQDPALFYDAVHLNVLGALSLTERLAKELPHQSWFAATLTPKANNTTKGAAP